MTHPLPNMHKAGLYIFVCMQAAGAKIAVNICTCAPPPPIICVDKGPCASFVSSALQTERWLVVRCSAGGEHQLSVQDSFGSFRSLLAWFEMFCHQDHLGQLEKDAPFAVRTVSINITRPQALDDVPGAPAGRSSACNAFVISAVSE